MKSKILKFTLGSIVAVAALGLVAFVVWVGYFFYLMGGSCGNNVLEAINSPDRSKKVVLFVRDCGATTDWSLQASITKPSESISDSDTGNILTIDSDHGAAWPKGPYGSLVVAKWVSNDRLEVYYSQNSRVFNQTSKFEGVNIEYYPTSTENVFESAIDSQTLSRYKLQGEDLSDTELINSLKGGLNGLLVMRNFDNEFLMSAYKTVYNDRRLSDPEINRLLDEVTSKFGPCWGGSCRNYP